MSERWVGMIVSGTKVTVVDVEILNIGTPILQMDETWSLQKGDRPESYHTISQQCINYLAEKKIDKVIIKESAIIPSNVNLSHLHSAELRGVIQAAAASVCKVTTISKAVLSRNLGERNVDEYIDNDDYWDQCFDGKTIRKRSRESAILVLAKKIYCDE